jgi:hypothetical protein
LCFRTLAHTQKLVLVNRTLRELRLIDWFGLPELRMLSRALTSAQEFAQMAWKNCLWLYVGFPVKLFIIFQTASFWSAYR